MKDDQVYKHICVGINKPLIPVRSHGEYTASREPGKKKDSENQRTTLKNHNVLI